MNLIEIDESAKISKCYNFQLLFISKYLYSRYKEESGRRYIDVHKELIRHILLSQFDAAFDNLGHFFLSETLRNVVGLYDNMLRT